MSVLYMEKLLLCVCVCNTKNRKKINKRKFKKKIEKKLKF